MTIIRRLLGARGFSPSEQFQRGFSRGIASGSPDPTWTPRAKQPIPFEGAHVALDPRELQSCYPLMISAFVPRPIALVSSLSAAGVGNVAPFSYSGVVNHDPPAIAVSVCRVGAGGGRTVLLGDPARQTRWAPTAGWAVGAERAAAYEVVTAATSALTEGAASRSTTVWRVDRPVVVQGEDERSRRVL